MRELLKNISPFNNRSDMPVIVFTVKKILAFWVCYIAGLFIAEGFVILLHFALGKNMFAGEVFDTQTITLIIYYGYIIVSGITLLYWKWIEKKPFVQMGLTRHFGSYFAGIGTGVVLLMISVAVIVLTGNMEYHGVNEETDIKMLLLLIGGFVIQGATEEILCRGFLLHSLKEKASLKLAVGISTAMFIVNHGSSLCMEKSLIELLGIINMALISLIFSFFTVRFKSIWAACGLHSFWNAILYGVLGLNLSGNESSVAAVFQVRSVGANIWNGGRYGIEGSILTTAVLALALLVMFVCAGKKNRIDL